MNGYDKWSVLILTLLFNSIVQAQSIQHVVIISFDGLRPDAIEILGPQQAPNFYKLIQEGSSSLNARSDHDNTRTLPNHTTMLTARPVLGDQGHNFTENGSTDTTLHLNKGEYLASFFDVAHDFGLTTALFASKDKFEVYVRSYNAVNGASDKVGENNGKQKIDIAAVTDYDDETTLANFLAAMQTPPHLTLLHFANPDNTGHDFNWDVSLNSAYMNKVKELDGFLQQVLEAVPPATAVIATADHGGGEPVDSHHIKTHPLNYTIPFWVWNNIDSGITPGSDLYQLNQDNGYADPGTDRVDYSTVPQPIRDGDVANLALSLLCLPPIPGSLIGQSNTLALTSTIAPQFNHHEVLNLTPIQVDDIHNPGTSVAELTKGLISSAKGCPITSIAVIEVNNTHGSWQYSTDNGSNWVLFNQPSQTQARLLTATDRIRLVPQPGYHGIVNPGIQFRAWDSRIGQYQGVADTLTEAFSQEIATAQITVSESSHHPPPIDNPEPPSDHTLPIPLKQPPSMVQMNITVAGSGQGRIISQPYGIDCHNFTQTNCPPSHRSDFIFHCLPWTPPHCQYEFKQHPSTQVELIPQPGANSVFLGWGNDEACAQGPLTMIKDRYCTAYFAALHTLMVTQAGFGSGRIISYDEAHQPSGIDCGGHGQVCSQRFRDNRRVVLQAAPATGSVFQAWSGDCQGQNQFILVPMDRAKHCVALFH